MNRRYDTKEFFEAEGVSLKVERGKRVFPVSDQATEVVDSMVRACKNAGVEIIFDKVKSIIRYLPPKGMEAIVLFLTNSGTFSSCKFEKITPIADLAILFPSSI